MPILKAPTHRSASKDAVVLDLGDLGRQAAKLRALAETKAENILTQARQDADQLTKGATEAGDQRGYTEGLERGRQEGQEQGKADAQKQYGEQLQQVQQQWAAATAEYEKHFIACEKQAWAAALQLAAKLAEKVIHRRVQTDSTLVLDQLAAALSHVLEPARVKVRIHPDDRDILTEALPGLLDSIEMVTHADLIDDPETTRGGCVVTSGPATIDARIETQLDRLASLLLGEQSFEKSPQTPEIQTETHHDDEPDANP